MHPNELPVPTSASSDDDATELARVWIADGRQVMILASNVWDDPAAWGLMLVDMARQAARQYAATSRIYTDDSALQRIKEGFDIEWEHPTE